jgi:hypothetical protein
MPNGIIAEATANPTLFRTQASPLSHRTILFPRNYCAKFARNSRNGHKLASHGHGTSASASIPRTVPVRALSIAFPRAHTFPIRIQSVTAIRPQSIRSVSGKCPHSIQWLSHLPRERRLCCSSNREFPNDGSAVARNRAGCAFDCCLSPAAYQSLWICRAFLLAFRVVVFVASAGRLTVSRWLSRRASVAESVGFCPLAPDGRTAIDRPGNGPRSIASHFVAVNLNNRFPFSLCVLRFSSADGAEQDKPDGRPNQKQ